MSRRLILASIPTTAALTAAAAGCGGSPGKHVAHLGSSTSTTIQSGAAGATDKYAAWLAYSRCMRTHGVSGYPDPKRIGDTIQISGSPPGLNPRSPVFVSAAAACRQRLPGGAAPSRTDQARELARLRRVSRCMRTHGISGFPDPTLTQPSGRSGYSDIVSNGVAWLAIPASIDVRSPPFVRAATSCNLNGG